MKRFILLLGFLGIVYSCQNESKLIDNPKIEIPVPKGFPELNPLIHENYPTKYGVELGFKLFNDKRLSNDNSISCATCHQIGKAYADSNPISIGIQGRVGLRNSPPIQNMGFLREYMWDGEVVDLAQQPLTPIITHEEMDSTILEIISKLGKDKDYREAFKKAFGDEEMNAQRIFGSLAQYMYTLISANSKYDRVLREMEVFTADEKKGYDIFQNKCASCHKGALQTDETFRNKGFPQHPDQVEEHGRARVTGDPEDYLRFRVPSLRNIEYTAPYGSFGQFATLKEVLDYMDSGVKDYPNLDKEMKKRTDGKLGISLTEEEKKHLITFMKTLSDKEFVTIRK